MSNPPNRQRSWDLSWLQTPLLWLMAVYMIVLVLGEPLDVYVRFHSQAVWQPVAIIGGAVLAAILALVCVVNESVRVKKVTNTLHFERRGITSFLAMAIVAILFFAEKSTFNTTMCWVGISLALVSLFVGEPKKAEAEADKSWIAEQQEKYG